MKEHKHAELIRKWADGHEIECETYPGWAIDPTPSWSICLNYRLRPKTKTYEYRRYILNDEIKVIDRSKCHEDINYSLFFDSNVRWIDNNWISSEINI